MRTKEREEASSLAGPQTAKIVTDHHPEQLKFPCTGKRFDCNMLSATANTGKLYFMVFKEQFSSDIFIEFMDSLVRQYPRKVFLIVDNHCVHTSRNTREWITDNSDDISVFYPPA
jgi:hypothetical protein